MTTNVSKDRFDGMVHWKTLSPEQQDAVGAAALEYVAGSHAAEQDADDTFLTPKSRTGHASWDAATDVLCRVVVDAMPITAWSDSRGQALIPSCIGPVCRVCGCSENDPCPQGCGWAAEDLCTACVGAASPGGDDAQR